MKSIYSNLPVWLSLGLLLIALGLGGWAYWVSQHATVKIEWTTASELNTVGFNIYRRESTDGPETRINSELIPASTDPLAGGTYQMIDKNARPGVTYYYELEDVETDGVTNRSWQTSVSVARQGLVEAAAAIVLGLFALGSIYAGLHRARVSND